MENSINDENVSIDLLRQAIRRSFPDEIYRGSITYNDEQLDDPELDEDRDLYNALRGQKWTDVPTNLLLALPCGYELLADEAFVAFLPAWLMYSLEDMDSENEIRNFLAYSFGATMRRFRGLNPAQQTAVRSVLMEFTQRGTSKFVRKHAVDAVALIDRRRY